MKKLKKFIKEKNLIFSENRISEKELENIELKLNFKFGKELKEYILEYGFLIGDGTELQGITKEQYLESDMIVNTVYLRSQNISFRNYVVLEKMGDGEFTLIDENDDIYNFDYNLENKLNNLNKKLSEYIFEIF